MKAEQTVIGYALFLSLLLHILGLFIFLMFWVSREVTPLSPKWIQVYVPKYSPTLTLQGEKKEGIPSEETLPLPIAKPRPPRTAKPQELSPQHPSGSQAETQSLGTDSLSAPEEQLTRAGEVVISEEEILGEDILPDTTPLVPLLPDINWTHGGEPPKLSYLPEVRFDFPKGGYIPSHVIVSFLVYTDGSVGEVRITPPGTGSVVLDRQIKDYVASLYFAYARVESQGTLNLELSPKEESKF